MRASTREENICLTSNSKMAFVPSSCKCCRRSSLRLILSTLSEVRFLSMFSLVRAYTFIPIVLLTRSQLDGTKRTACVMWRRAASLRFTSLATKPTRCVLLSRSDVIHALCTLQGENDYEIYTHGGVKGHSVKGPSDTMQQVKALLHWN